MTLLFKNRPADPTRYQMDLAIDVREKEIRVRAGTIRDNGRELTLMEDETFELETRPQQTLVLAYLVVDKASDRLRVMVDEFVVGQDDRPYTFREGGPYEVIQRLFQGTIPPHCQTFEDAEIHVFRYVQAEAPKDGGKNGHIEDKP
jgi:hypothetical protein